MQVRLCVETLDYIAKESRGWGKDQRLASYGAVAEIDRFLRSVVEEKKLPHKTFEELRRYRFSYDALCGLGLGNGHSEEQHVSWMMGAVQGLKADMCLGSVLDDPE